MARGFARCRASVVVSVAALWLGESSSAALISQPTVGGSLCFAPPAAWALPVGRAGCAPPSSPSKAAPAPRRQVLGGLRGELGKGADDGVQGPAPTLHRAAKAARAATLSLFLLGAALLPAPKQASARAGDSLSMGPDGTIQGSPQGGGLPLGKIGAAAGASVVTFGSACAISIKRERRRCEGDRAELEKDIARLNSFKEEFLEGKISDRSLYSSLKKKTKKTSDEDDFDRNVREFMEEEETKKKGKKDPKRKESPTVLERPGDKAPGDDDLDDIEEDHSPAVIDESVRLMLEKMLGGGEEDKSDKKK